MAQLSVSCSSFQLYYVWNSSIAFQSRAECPVTLAGMPCRKDLAVVGLRRVFRFSNCGDVLFRILARVRSHWIIVAAANCCSADAIFSLAAQMNNFVCIFLFSARFLDVLFSS